MFISFEGGDGAGKTTQINALAAQLEAQGRRVLCLREPGSSPGAEAIRNLLLNGAPDRWVAVEELFLFSAARHELVRTKIKPALAGGTVVLCDRFADSSAVYQGRAGGLAPDILEVVEALATGGLRPDLTFLIDVPPHLGLARADQRLQQQGDQDQDQAEARFEGKDALYHQAVRQAFLDRAAQFPQRFRLIDGAQAREAVAQDVWQAFVAFQAGHAQ